MNLPNNIKVLDITYKIEYVDTPTDTDPMKRQAMWGSCDYWTRTIKIYRKDRTEVDVWQTVWHEILHAICDKMDIDVMQGRLNGNEKAINLLATGINCVLRDNNFD